MSGLLGGLGDMFGLGQAPRDPFLELARLPGQGNFQSPAANQAFGHGMREHGAPISALELQQRAAWLNERRSVSRALPTPRAGPRESCPGCGAPPPTVDRAFNALALRCDYCGRGR